MSQRIKSVKKVITDGKIKKHISEANKKKIQFLLNPAFQWQEVLDLPRNFEIPN